MGKLSKREIKQNLENTPIDTLLLGKNGKRELTHKQKQFAKGVANGLTKSEAYRQAYETTQNPSAVHSDAQKLMRNPRISHLIEAYQQANEAREYQSPARLRELVIHQLTMHALSEEIPPAQRIKSLELLGKVTEVGAFTERKESIVVHQSAQLKAKLLDQLKTIVNEDGSEITEDEGDKLLRELMGVGSSNTQHHEPTHSAPPEQESDHPESYTHINPHTQSSPETDPDTNSDSSLTDAIHDQNGIVNENKELHTGNVTSVKKEGVGGEEKAADAGWEEYKEDPPSNLGTMDKGGV